jgi:hypothetical protein
MRCKSVVDRIEKKQARADHLFGTSIEDADPEMYEWYASTCPCGLPPGDCTEHPRARPTQRPPDGEWSRWFLMAGRGFGKTKAGAEWVRHLAESGKAQRIAIVGPTREDTRLVMVEGVSGILAVSPPWFRPVYTPSLRQLVWPNGVIATCYSADKPDGLRGYQHDHAWIDEPGAWRRGMDAFDMLMLGMRLGTSPQVVATSTPKSTRLIKSLVVNPKTHLTTGTTYDNRRHLAPAFYTEIVSLYEGTRLGEQELNAQLLEITDGAWFPMFSVARHVSEAACYQTGPPVHVAIDAGTSRHTGAVFFQIRPHHSGWPQVVVFGDYYAKDVVSAENAEAILKECKRLSYSGPDVVRLDPAANARTSIGPAAYNEYERVFGHRVIGRWPSHPVNDGLDQLELMLGKPPDEPRILIHPRCRHLIHAFQNYRRAEHGGEFLDTPEPEQHKEEDLMDALRGGIRDAMPEGRKPPSVLRTIPVGRLY